MRIYNRIYPDHELGRLLAEVYRGVLLFARKATEYCLSLRGQYHDRLSSNHHFPKVTDRLIDGEERIKHTLGKPVRFRTVEQGMRDSLTSMRIRCEALLANDVAILREQNTKSLKNEETIQEQNNELLKKVETLQDQSQELRKEIAALQGQNRHLLERVKGTLKAQECGLKLIMTRVANVQ